MRQPDYILVSPRFIPNVHPKSGIRGGANISIFIPINHVNVQIYIDPHVTSKQAVIQ